MKLMTFMNYSLVDAFWYKTQLCWHNETINVLTHPRMTITDLRRKITDPRKKRKKICYRSIDKSVGNLYNFFDLPNQSTKAYIDSSEGSWVRGNPHLKQKGRCTDWRNGRNAILYSLHLKFSPKISASA